MSLFKDGIQHLVNKLANRRDVRNTNVITACRTSPEELRAIYKTGIGSKIIRLKTGIALDEQLQFESEADKDYYEARLQQHVKRVAKFQLAFGRGLLVIHEPGADLTQPLRNITDWSAVRYQVFSGDMVFVQAVNFNLNDVDYLQPTRFMVRGYQIHPSRVVDFRYVEPPELDAPGYQFGGISEFELIRNELVADQIVQRAVPSILEKCATVFYKVVGFKDLIASRREDEVLRYFGALESARSIYGAGIVDAEDEIEVVNQALSNLSDSDMVTLRRLAMVTGLPLSWLVGEAARGLNSTGEGERQVLRMTIQSYQSEYLLDNINRLMKLHGRGRVWFKDGLLETDVDRIDYERKAVDIALILWQMGEDYQKYLQDKDVVTPNTFDDFFAEAEDEPEPPLSPDTVDEA